MAATRKANGQFAKGSKGGPGRPKKKREERYLEITMSACTYPEWKAVIKKAVEQAKRGDNQARRFLADYLIGPPQQRMDVTSGGERIKGYIGISPDDWDE